MTRRQSFGATSFIKPSPGGVVVVAVVVVKRRIAEMGATGISGVFTPLLGVVTSGPCWLGLRIPPDTFRNQLSRDTTLSV